MFVKYYQENDKKKLDNADKLKTRTEIVNWNGAKQYLKLSIQVLLDSVSSMPKDPIAFIRQYKIKFSENYC